MYPWLRDVTQKITNQFLSKRLHHGLLIEARAGMGKFELTRDLSQVLLCQTPNIEACGQCKSCHLFKHGNHPDYFQISDLDANSIGVDQIRALVNKSQHKSQLGGNLVFVVNQSYKMTESAANALLKTLEEPFPHSYIILTTESVSQLLPTLISRCQLYKIKSPTLPELLPWLNEQKIEPTQFDVIFEDMGQAPLTALAHYSTDYLLKRAEYLSQFKALLSGKVSTAEFSKTINEEDIAFYYIWLMQALNKWMKVKSQGVDLQIPRQDQRYKIMDMYQAVLTSQRQSHYNGVNKKLNYQQLCHKISHSQTSGV